MNKELIKAISNVMKETLTEIAEDVINKTSDDKNTDKKTIIINIDEDVLAKKLVQAAGIKKSKNVKDDDDEEDDDEEDNKYMDMPLKKQKSLCVERGMKVTAKDNEEILAKRLYAYDQVVFEENESEPEEADSEDESIYTGKSVKELKHFCLQKGIKIKKSDDEKSLMKKLDEFDSNEEDDEEYEEDETDENRNELVKSLNKVITDSGLNPKDVKFDLTVKGKKKSLVLTSDDNDEEDEKFDSELKDVDLKTVKGINKSFNSLTDEDQDEIVKGYMQDKFKLMNG